MSIFKKIWTAIKGLFSGLHPKVKEGIHTGVQVVENLRKFVDSGYTDLLAELIPGALPKEIKDKLRDALPKIVTNLKLVENWENKSVDAILLEAIKAIDDIKDPNTQSAFLHSLSILIAQVAADGKLSWEDGAYVLEWYYRQEFKKKSAK